VGGGAAAVVEEKGNELKCAVGSDSNEINCSRRLTFFYLISLCKLLILL